MTRDRYGRHSPRPREISRRDLLKLAAAGLLAGCRPPRQLAATLPTHTSTIAPTDTPTAPPIGSPTSAPTSSPTAPPSHTPTSAPTATPTNTPTAPPIGTPTSAPTSTPTALPTSTPTRVPTATPTSSPTTLPTRAPVAGPGTVVVARHGGVWDGRTLVPETIRHMLDASITGLTGLDDADAAWASLFNPGERVAIKVNTIMASSETHVPLVMAVTERLQAVGVPPEQIVIFDRDTNELKFSGYPINRDGPGVRCYGTDGNYKPGWKISGVDVKLSDILLNCEALINIPILKQHGYAGISFAMKNHFGTFDRPGRFHGSMGLALPGLNALQPIRDRTRLIIGDTLKVVLGDQWTNKVPGDSILMSFDPVAHDTVGLQMFTQVMVAAGKDPTGYTKRATAWLANGAGLGLGIHDPDGIKLVDIR